MSDHTPRLTDPIRWGILGTGAIAKTFARGLAQLPDHRLVAVGSRTREAAAAFAQEFPAAIHGSYEALCADPQVDAVYVASPHTGHRDHALLAIRHRKAVLVEKPFAVNAAEGAEIAAAARAAGVFCLEAMWTRFLPAVRQAVDWIAAGAIGEVRQVTADFGFRAEVDPASRLFSPDLAGGALLDVGIYPLALAFLAMGRPPQQVRAIASLGRTGVDEQSGILLGWDDGRLAALTCAIRTGTRHEAVIYGTQGRIELPAFWHGQTAILVHSGQVREVRELPFLGNGYPHEIVEVGRCLRAGLTESPVMPLAESLALLECLDECRRQIGLRYPGEA